MTEMTPERRRVVMICCGVAAMSSGPILLRFHSALLMVWIAVMFAALAYGIVLFVRLKESRR